MAKPHVMTALAAAFVATGALAQDATDAGDQSAVGSVIDSVADAASNLLGGGTAETAPDSPMAQAMKGVTEVALDLQSTVDQLAADIQSSAASSQEGARILDEMLAAATSVNDSLSNDSDVWVELNTLLETWSGKRDEMSKKAIDNPALQDVADLWSDRVTEGLALRTQILDQATASKLLVEDIEAQREVILAYYDVGATDQVLAGMRKVSDQLGQMNDNMRSMLDQAGVEVPDAARVSQ